MSQVEPLAPDEIEFISQALKRLRDHFKVWASSYGPGREYELIGFAQYEGSRTNAACCRIVEEVVPFALGQHLVEYYGFEWVALIRPVDTRVYALRHPAMDDVIDLFAIESGQWCDGPESDEEPYEPGEATYLSLESIVKASKQKLKGYY